MDIFWGWLTNDQFTHQHASFLGHDVDNACDVWQHNGKPIYPDTANQTACVHMVAGKAVPVYMHFYDEQGGDDRQAKKKTLAQNTTYSNFKVVDTFPAGAFVPPSPCPVTAAAAAPARGPQRS